jgi:hypothetical protein
VVDLSNLKNISLKMDERNQLRAQIGLSIGIIPMFIAAFVGVVILSQFQIWYKIAAGLGLGCALIMQIMGAVSAIKRYKAYNAAMAEYDRMNNNPQPTNYTG